MYQFFHPVFGFDDAAGQRQHPVNNVRKARPARSSGRDNQQQEVNRLKRRGSHSRLLNAERVQELDFIKADEDVDEFMPPVPRDSIFEPSSPKPNIHEELKKHIPEKLETEKSSQKATMKKETDDDRIVNEVFLAVSTSARTNANSKLIPLRDYPTAESLSAGIMKLMGIKTEQISVTVKYGWWLDRRLEFVLSKEKDYAFLLERVAEYPGIDGKCVVSMEIRPVIRVGC